MHILDSIAVSTLLRDLTPGQYEQLHTALSTSLIDHSAQIKASKQDGTAMSIHQPTRTHFTTSDGITTLIMPVSDTRTTGVKVVAVAPGASPRGAITVYSAAGELLGVLNAGDITGFRTALASMVALSQYCTDFNFPQATNKSGTGVNVVVFGAGRQAEWHVRLVLRALQGSVGRIAVINRSPKRLEEFEDTVFSKDLRGKHPNVQFVTIEHRRESSDFKSALSDADVILGTTPSTEPLFPASYLKNDTGVFGKRRFLSLIGSYKPEMQEIDSETLLSGMEGGYGKIVVDTKEACLVEAGELIKAGLQEEQLVEIGELKAGDVNLTDSLPEGGNVIFKCVGMGLMDLVISKELVEIAKQAGVGLEVASF